MKQRLRQAFIFERASIPGAMPGASYEQQATMVIVERGIEGQFPRETNSSEP